MKIINQSHEIVNISFDPMGSIEDAARGCYQSESGNVASRDTLVKSLVKSGHHAMLEFADMTAVFVTDKGITHELVRHRLCSFAQESTRYVNYDKEKFGNEIKFIMPVVDVPAATPLLPSFLHSASPEAFLIWEKACRRSEAEYMAMLKYVKPQVARSVLNHSVKTEIRVKANFREWAHIFSLRKSLKAHPQMRALILPLYRAMADMYPVIFGEV